MFWLGKNFPSVKILQGAKPAHNVYGIISLFNQNPRVFMMTLVSLGIMNVSNLFDRKGVLKNWETASQEFNLNPIHFLKWYGVLRSHSKQLEKSLRSHNVEKRMISEDSQYGIEANGKFIPINSVTAKSVYNLCISHKFSPPTSKNFCQLNLTLKIRKPGPQFIYYPLV